MQCHRGSRWCCTEANDEPSVENGTRGRTRVRHISMSYSRNSSSVKCWSIMRSRRGRILGAPCSLRPVADLGGCGGCGRTPLGVIQKNSWFTNFENSEDSRQHDYYYYQFLPCSYLLRNFLNGRRERGHEWAWGTPKAPDAAPPLQKSWIRH